jgi:hypothetical protein
MSKKNKLTYNEQYSYFSFMVGGEDIDDLSQVKIKNETYKTVKRHISTLEYEMGHRYVVNSTKYFLIQKVAGVNAEIDLCQFLDKVPVYATKYSIKKKEDGVAVRRRTIR